MPAAVVAVVVALQLGGADIAIVVTADSAVVEARYEFAAPVDTLTFYLIRLRDQDVEILPGGHGVDTLAVDELPGLTRLTAYGSRLSARIRYVVTGDLSRIPIPVPDLATEAGERHVRLRVGGVSEAARLAEAFPRLEREEDGSAVARLNDLPSFVRLPPEANAWTLSRTSQVLVVVLLVAAAGSWLLWRRIRRLGPEG